uniref:Transmembrane protein n=1 Tax=Arabidopsis thaliana TaxID=3702 RepID=Q56XA5_ARATH|nr:unknown protein [Arabidopsis thaliana]BAD93868.1 hypothetical protein [Arabidopsis thaliana]
MPSRMFVRLCSDMVQLFVSIPYVVSLDGHGDVKSHRKIFLVAYVIVMLHATLEWWTLSFI